MPCGVRSKALTAHRDILLFMTGLDLLVLLGYIPYTICGLFIGDKTSQVFLEAWTHRAMIHQLLCLISGSSGWQLP